MFIYKKLKASDANTIAFEAHKEWNINGGNTSSLGITLVETSFSSASRDTYSKKVNDPLNHKQYFQLNHLFYKDALFNYGSLLGGIDYNTQEKRLYDKATVISLSQKTFGSSVQKGTFLFNNNYKDDSKGNIYPKAEVLTNYPLDKERIFYLAPVDGFKYTDLTRDPNTGESIVNSPTTYNSLKLDDSLYINPVEYISCSLVRNATINCTEVNLTNGYIKAPNSNNYNFGNEDFTITFYYKTSGTSTPKYIIAKSKTKTVVEYPESNLNGSLKNTHGSASLLQPKEVDAGKAFPFEVVINGSRRLEFRRSDQDILSSITGSIGAIANGTLQHVACVKSGSNLKLYIDGVQNGANQPDNTTQCKNKADLFIGTDPTISSSKLDNTEDQQISQLMIWNKALSSLEIANVSESIDGSPYVGNIFYENGIATLTSPKVNNSTLTSLVDNDVVINLFPADFTQDDPTANPNYPTPTFSSSLTFTSSVETLRNVDGSDIYPNLIYSNTYLSASIDGEEISLSSRLNAIPFDPYVINPISSESIQSISNYIPLTSSVSPINGGPGTGSGESGTDGDSLVKTGSAQFNGFISLYLAENQTVTQSINILHISNSQEITTETFPVSDTSIGDTVFDFDGSSFTSDGLDYNFVNDGGAYVDNENVAYKFLMVSGATANTPFYQGQIKRGGGPGAQGPIDAPYSYPDYTLVEFQAAQNTDNSVYYCPPDLDCGIDFDFSNNRIELLEAIPQDEDGNDQQLHFQVSASLSNILPEIPSGQGRYLQARVRRQPVGGGSDNTFYEWDTMYIAPGDGTSFNFSSEFYGGLGVGDTLTLEVRMRTANNNYAASSEYKISTCRFKVMGIANVSSTGYGNKAILRHAASTTAKANSLYEYTLEGIITRPGAGAYSTIFSQNNTIGLSKDMQGNDVGVRVSLFQGNQLITSSLYPSSSGDSAQDFTYKHFTDTTFSGTLKLYAYPGIASHNFPVITGANQGFAIGAVNEKYYIEEISGSNVMQLSNTLENRFTGSENISSVVTFVNKNYAFLPTYPLPDPITPSILGFVNNDKSKIILSDTYFSTSSFTTSASLERGNYISGSASIDITSTTKGLYKVESLVSSTANLSSYGDYIPYVGIPSTQKLKITTKVNGASIDTRYVDGQISSNNSFQTEESKLHLGILDNTDNVSFDFSIVDLSNNPIKSVKNEGFFLNEFTLSKITSSNEVTLVNGGVWQGNIQQLQLDFPYQSQLDLLQFSSSHINTGSAANALFPFNTGSITASVISGGQEVVELSPDFKTLYLADNYLITSSLSLPLHNVDGVQNGPFIISASYLLNPNPINAQKEYTISQSFTVDNINPDSPIANHGFGQTLSYGTGGEGTTIVNENYYEDDGHSSSINIIRDNDFSDTQIVYNLFVSGVASNKYPTGVITASMDYTQSFTPTLKLTAISGSNISSGPEISADAFGPYEGYSSNLLRITSSHTNDPHTPNLPLYTLGKKDVGILELVGGQVKVNETLFITASSDATGSSPSSSWNPGDYHFIPSNPVDAYGIEEYMIGGTFSFTDKGTLETSIYEITFIEMSGISEGAITLQNLSGGSDAIQTTDATNLTSSPPVTVTYTTIVANEFTVQYKNSHLIFENEYHCTVDEDEYNHTLNPTARKLKDIDSGELAPFATSSNFKPYVTTVGLYNEGGELLVVGKLGQPIKMSDETDTTFVIRYDT